MNWLEKKRIKQVRQYGWKDAKEIAPLANTWRIAVWFDIIKCFKKYYVFSNQYKAKEVWKLNDEERDQMLRPLGEKNRYRDDWTVWKYENAAFVDKYSSVKYGTDPKLYNERLKEYMKRYNIGEGAKVSNNVTIEKNHYLDGSIKIGKNVMLSKNVYLDYSGELIIQDDVSLANGVIIETHTHLIEKKGAPPVPGRLLVEQGASILTRSYIADTCHVIGRHARIGAGSYVRSNIPPYAIVIGNPAKIIGFLFSPEEMVRFEEKQYSIEDRTSLELYERYYDKYFRKKTKEIRDFVRL